ncbi:hypothetical protein HPF70_0754, partial [Helicobacter pylori]
VTSWFSIGASASSIFV